MGKRIIERKVIEMQNAQGLPVDVKGVFSYLDDLRMLGTVNMFDSVKGIESEFYVDSVVARSLLSEWMQTFVDRSRRDQE